MERELGVQPINAIMKESHLDASDLVRASKEQITYKMVSRACKGRRLTPHIQAKICSAVNSASGKNFMIEDLFNY